LNRQKMFDLMVGNIEAASERLRSGSAQGRNK